MTLRWSEFAAEDLEGIYDFIAADNPDKASQAITTITEGAEQLLRWPMMGLTGRLTKTRELVLKPYILVYRLDPAGETIFIEGVIHAARELF